MCVSAETELIEALSSHCAKLQGKRMDFGGVSGRTVKILFASSAAAVTSICTPVVGFEESCLSGHCVATVVVAQGLCWLPSFKRRGGSTLTAAKATVVAAPVTAAACARAETRQRAVIVAYRLCPC